MSEEMGVTEEVRGTLALALDVDDLVAATRLARELQPWFGDAKVGLELYSAAGPDAVAAVRELSDGGVHYSIEAIGLKATAEQSWQMLRRGGLATIIGMIPPGDMVSLHGPDFLFEKKIQGSFMGSNRFRVDMPRYVELYLQGKLHLDDMVSSHIKLEDLNDAMAQLETGEIARNVILFDA